VGLLLPGLQLVLDVSDAVQRGVVVSADVVTCKRPSTSTEMFSWLSTSTPSDRRGSHC
jgi:hypothetical protein